jgi:hypothetical protein
VPSVDVWGFNVYRNASFGDLFRQWESISAEPMFVSEFGADSYDHRTGSQNEAMQAAFDAGLWDEVFFDLSADRVRGVAIGALAFEFQDEWWKNGDPSAHDISGETNGGQPDGINDEEHFGVMTIDRTPKQAYTVMQSRFTNGQAAVELDATPVLRAESQRCRPSPGKGRSSPSSRLPPLPRPSPPRSRRSRRRGRGDGDQAVQRAEDAPLKATGCGGLIGATDLWQPPEKWPTFKYWRAPSRDGGATTAGPQ